VLAKFHVEFSTEIQEIFIKRARTIWEYAVAQSVEALRYKPEGRAFDSRWCYWNFSLT
jgi:hypothetical protein